MHFYPQGVTPVPCIEIIDPDQDLRWDRFVEDHQMGLLYHLSAWKSVVESTFPHIKGYCIALVENGAIRAALPIYEVKSWLTGHRWVHIPFAQFSDPLVSSASELAVLIHYVQTELGAKVLDIKSMYTSFLFEQLNLAQVHHSEYHYILLDKPPELLQKQFHRTCVRQRISRAVNSGVQVKRCEAASELETFIRLHVRTRKRLGLPPQPDNFFYNLWHFFPDRNRMEIVFATKENSVIAALLLFKFNKRITVDISAYDERFLHCSPTHLLFWETIKSSYEQGYRIYDFGRTSRTSEALCQFKNHWGTQTMDLPSYVKPFRNRPNKMIKEYSLKYKLIKQICRFSPQPVYQMIGKLVYRHLG